jgi:hypothetical protein
LRNSSGSFPYVGRDPQRLIAREQRRLAATTIDGPMHQTNHSTKRAAILRHRAAERSYILADLSESADAPVLRRSLNDKLLYQRLKYQVCDGFIALWL